MDGRLSLNEARFSTLSRLAVCAPARARSRGSASSMVMRALFGTSFSSCVCT